MFSTPEVPERQPLTHLTEQVLEECRMVLPGIQALFGFQLVAVFNQVFWEKLTQSDRVLHLIAMVVVAMAVALVMAPAAYHRLNHMDTITHRFVLIASRLVLLSLVPLLIGMSLDMYLIASLILHDRSISLVVAIVVAVFFIGCWWILPFALPSGVVPRDGHHRWRHIALKLRPPH